MSDNLEHLEKLALKYEETGDLSSLKECYEKILVQSPSHEPTLNALAILYAHCKEIKLAAVLLERLIKTNINNAAAYSNLGNCYTEMGDLLKAKHYFEKAIEINPQLIDAHYNLGNTFCSMNQYHAAIKCYLAAINLNPDLPHLHFNLGNSYAMTGSYPKALEQYKPIEAIYDTNPNYCFLVGCSYFGIRNFNQAIHWLLRAIEIKKINPDAYNELGRIHSTMGLNHEALGFYLKAYDQDPDNATFIHNTIYHYIRLGDFPKAYEFAQKIKSHHDKQVVLQMLSMTLCQWDGISELNDFILKTNEIGKITGWDFLRTTDSAEVQHRFMKLFSNQHFPLNPKLGPIPLRTPGAKIKIGYFSPDFRNHAVMHLSADIFKMHNRNDFEIHAFSFHPKHTDQEREKLRIIFDHLHEVNDLTEFDIASKARELGIDIAVDLTGNTKDQRTGIFALRAAPVQINFLGYTGTMGTDYFDYIVVDPVIVPVTHQKFYSEKCIYLKSFMPRQIGLLPSPKPMSRAQFGLPPEGFIFCCFNKSLKITPEVFNSWMNILKAVPGSYLWFNGMPELAATNLKNTAGNSGVDAKRLIFSQPVSDMSTHLARHRFAGLFLDTYPYNAHTTSSDALWSGLPVVTRSGDSFASRVSTSLLKNLDLSELITDSIKDYEILAIRLAHHPDELTQLKKKLKSNIKTERLFNMKQYMVEYECAIKLAYKSYIDGQSPAVIDVTQERAHG
jgi:predicted O-linked N-acetylglucosamine transferase (SPINDLY family)